MPDKNWYIGVNAMIKPKRLEQSGDFALVSKFSKQNVLSMRGITDLKYMWEV